MRRFIRASGVFPLSIFSACAILLNSARVLADAHGTLSSVALPSLAVPKLSAQTDAAKPKLDGSLDDPAWQHAAVISSLPLCTHPPSKDLSVSPTEVRVMWDDHNIYVRFRCVDENVYSPHGKTNDVLHSDGDVAEIFIDPVGDQRQFFELQCNPVGGHVDGLHVITTQPVSDADGLLAGDIPKRDQWFAQNWEIKGLQVGGAAFDDGKQKGWIADFALPAEPILHRLAMKKYAPMKLRINFIRYDVTLDADGTHKKAVDMAWSPVVWGRPHRSPAMMGTIELKAE